MNNEEIKVENLPAVLAMTTNYLCNEWLDRADLALFEAMKRNNPRRYRVAGLGEWGVDQGLVYDNWVESAFSLDEVRLRAGVRSAFGLDFGYTNDPTALFCGLVDAAAKEIFVFDELYQKALTNKMIYRLICEKGYAKETIRADSAEPKSIDELRALGLRNIRPARKGRDSLLNGIQFVQGFRLVVHPRCQAFLREISAYAWEAGTADRPLNRPSGDGNHLMDAMRYGLEPFLRGDVFSFE